MEIPTAKKKQKRAEKAQTNKYYYRTTSDLVYGSAKELRGKELTEGEIIDNLQRDTQANQQRRARDEQAEATRQGAVLTRMAELGVKFGQRVVAQDEERTRQREKLANHPAFANFVRKQAEGMEEEDEKKVSRPTDGEMLGGVGS